MRHPTVSLKRASELLKIGQNSSTVSSVFSLSFNELGTPEALMFVGNAFRDNTNIEWLEIDLCGKLVPQDCLSGLLHFISNSPSLRVLEIASPRQDADAQQSAPLQDLILDAAARSKSIGRVTIGNMFVGTALPTLTKQLEVSTSLRELTIHGLPDNFAGFWPDNHQLETIRLFGCEKQPMADYRNNLSALLLALTRFPSSQFIKHLKVSDWSSSLPTFLLSENSSLRSLSLNANFRHTPEGLSAIDGLLWGLSGSKTTKELIIEGVENMDQIAVKKLLQGLRSNALGIKHLTTSANNMNGDEMRELFGCDCLDSLRVSGVSHENYDTMLDALQGLSIPAFGYTDFQNIGNIGEQCKPVLAALNRLEIDGYFLTEDANLGYFLNILEDEDCQLRTLSLEHLGAESDSIPALKTVMKAVDDCPRMEKLCLTHMIQDGEQYTEELFRCVGRLKKIKHIKLVLPDQFVPLSLHEQLEESVSRSWSLEAVQVGSNAAFSGKLKPVLSPATQQKLHGIVQRNKLMNKISSIGVSNLSSEEKSKWLDHVKSMWALPDSLTLVFTLLQSRPGCFFCS